jgi:DNA-binding NarL/FixJ family response regulator
MPQPAKKKRRIFIADDHEIVRSGVRNLIESHGGYTCVGEAASGREAVRMAEELQPDVAIVDVTMPELNGIEAARQILKLCPKTKVLVFTVHDAEQVVVEIFRSGAHGYVLKSDAGRQLLEAIGCVLDGRHYFSQQVSEVIFGSMRSGQLPHTEAPAEEKPTTREREIIQLLAEGHSNKEVADKLGISVKTVETHRAAIMRKLGLHSIGELVRYAIRNHIIEA